MPSGPATRTGASRGVALGGVGAELALVVGLQHRQQPGQRLVADGAAGETSQPALGLVQQYRINRSRYYAGLYRDLIRTLRCGNIETWWTYEQYASRGVEPALGFIDSLGGRLERLRDRLGRTMENVQTNAIVNQTEATRDNTFQLELIANNVNHLAEKTDKLQEDASDLEKWVKWSAIIGVPLGIVGVLFAGLGVWKELVALWETIAPRLGL